MGDDKVSAHRRWLCLFLLAAASLVLLFQYGDHFTARFNYQTLLEQIPLEPKCEVPQLISSRDNNHNGLADPLDIVAGARQEVERGTIYDSSYYQGGYPPDGKGACTDVIWRAFSNAGLDLKQMVDSDILQNPQLYGATGAHPDPNIDFRRVGNLQIFFQRHGQELTTVIVPGNADNLSNWQAGDIVVFGAPLEHIGIISDQRSRNGVPLLIHNAGPQAREGQYLLTWCSPIIHHFRYFPYEENQISK
ncbi:MAG: DUF1287 domain-containing protein [Syntrophomonadaceae bacterium]|nr:DUF1287 domain-containing protein [Syntrophomonadaceae bacterium]